MSDEQMLRIERALAEIGQSSSAAESHINRIEERINRLERALAEIGQTISPTERNLNKIEDRINEVDKKVKKVQAGAFGSSDGFFIGFFYAVILAFIIGLTSNPSKEQHLARLTGRLTDNDPKIAAIRQQFPGLEPYLFKDLVRYDSYWCCSALVLKIKEIEIPISFGIFGNIFDTKTQEEFEERFGNHN